MAFRSTLFASPFVLAALFVAACGGDSGGDGGEGGGSASTATSMTTSTGGGPQSGSGGNTASSSSTGAPLIETVRTLDSVSKMPFPGVTVLVHDADGHIVDQPVTDANGEVEVQVPDGGGITTLSTTAVGRPAVTTHHVVTVNAIPDGGLVTLPYFDPPPPGPVVTHDPMIYIGVHVSGVPANAAHWYARASCGDLITSAGTSTVNTQLGYVGCPDRDDFEVIVWAESLSGTLLGAGKSATYPFTAGSGFGVNVAVAATNSQPYQSRIDGTPSDAVSAIMSFVGRDAAGNSAGMSFTQAPPLDPVEWKPGALPASYFDSWTMQASLSFGATQGSYRSANAAAVVTPFLFDAAAVQRQHVPDEDVSEEGHLLLAWNVDPGNSASASVITDVWGSPTERTQWMAITAPGAGHVRFPDLPSEDASWALQTGDHPDGARGTQTLDALDATYAGWLADPARGDDVTVSWAAPPAM